MVMPHTEDMEETDSEVEWTAHVTDSLPFANVGQICFYVNRRRDDKTGFSAYDVPRIVDIAGRKYEEIRMLLSRQQARIRVMFRFMHSKKPIQWAVATQGALRKAENAEGSDTFGILTKTILGQGLRGENAIKLNLFEAVPNNVVRRYFSLIPLTPDQTQPREGPEKLQNGLGI